MKKIVSVLFLSPAYAQGPAKWGQLPVEAPCEIGGVATIQGFECIFINLVRVLTPLVGLLLFVMLVIGSFKYLTSGGDPKKTQAAQQTLTFAILGLVLFLGIWFILQAIKLITGVDVTQFRIPGPND
ncbi:MAG TPA: hypothetical protein VMW25_01940 [Clostridia bacterium]|nr:hypothetical protein [Clostridia bacterium]